MKVVIRDGGQRHPACERFEVRAYATWIDSERARAQLERRGNRVTSYLDVAGPALVIQRWRDERGDDRGQD